MNDNNSKSLGKIDLYKINLPNKFKLPNLELDNHLSHVTDSIRSSSEVNRKLMDSFTEKHRKEEEYKQNVLNTLINIEKNTGDINQLVYLLNDKAEKQNEILMVMTEILSIGTSQTNEEAESKYRKVMSKITQTFEDAETMEKLLNYSKVFYHAAVEYIKQRIENG